MAACAACTTVGAVVILSKLRKRHSHGTHETPGGADDMNAPEHTGGSQAANAFWSPTQKIPDVIDLDAEGL